MWTLCCSGFRTDVWCRSRAVAFATVLLCWHVSALRADSFRFDSLGLEEGLSQATVTAIAQDTTGFLWFGTQEGLNRYDGLRFVVYEPQPDRPDSLPGRNISALAAAADGDLWVGTLGGLARWNHETDTFQVYRHDTAHPEGLSGGRVRVLLHEEPHSLWVGLENAGLNRLDLKTGRFESIPLFPNSDSGKMRTVLALHRNKEQRLWVGFRDGLAYLDDQQQTLIPLPLQPDIEMLSLGDHTDGRLRVGTQNGLFVLDLPSLSLLPFPGLESTDGQPLKQLIRTQLDDATGNLWLGTDDGLFLHSGGHTHRAGEEEERVTTLFNDRTGVLWVGTNKGIRRRYAPLFEHYRRDKKNLRTLSSSSVWPFSQGPDGDLWVGTFGGGLNRMDRESGTFTHYRARPGAPGSLPADHISALHHTQDGTLWVGTMRDGLCRMTAEDQFECFRRDDQDPRSLPDDGIALIFEDQHSELWLGTAGGGLARWLGDGAFQSLAQASSSPTGFGPESIVSAAETSPRNLWFASLEGGVLRLDRSTSSVQRFQSSSEQGGPNHDEVSSLLYDKNQDTLWIGTMGGGLNRLQAPNEPPRPDRWSQVPLPEDIFTQTIYGLTMDAAGHLWISTSRGLLRFNPDAGTFLHFITVHGLQGLDFTLGSAYRNPQGELFFGGQEGFNIIRPQDLDLPTAPPKVVLTAAYRHDGVLPLDSPTHEIDRLTLRHDDQFLRFEVAALDFVAPSKNRYHYRLLGASQEWIPMADEHSIGLNRLSPGSYTLEVQATNHLGIRSRPGLALPIRVPPPWWMSWPAYMLYALLVGAVTWAYARRQQRKIDRAKAISQQLMEVDRLKDEFLANTSHELRTPLHGMTGLAESLLETHGTGLSGMAKESLEMIVTSGRRLGGLVDDILDFQRLRRADLHLEMLPTHLRPLVHLSLKLTQPLVANKPIEMIDQMPLGLSPVLADENRVKQVLLNLLGNAIKFTQQGTIRISAREREETVEIEVADTGIGIADDKLDAVFEPFEQADASTVRAYQGTGLGLTISHQLIQHMGGRLWVQSRLGEGSSFFFSLPKANAPSRSPETESRDSLRHIAEEVATQQRTSQTKPSERISRTAPQEEGCNILVVDDESVNRQVLRNYLSQENHGVTFVDHGEAALQIVVEDAFDLVLLDVMMPQMSGYEVCRILRSEFSLEQLPIIFLTAKGQEADIKEGLSFGANDYLTKPISRGELLARIRPHLRLVKIYRQLGASVETKSHQLRILHGLLPICAQCKKIRDEGNQWQDFESYLDRNSEAEFSHSICPDCAEDLYPEYVSR